jgi:hypothetical protein
MVGHFPARCYPARGWDVRASRPRDWTICDLTLTGTEYEFTRPAEGMGGGEESIVVANCLLRPGGRMFRDMTAMSKSIAGAWGQSSGAGQIQIYFDASVPQDRRDAAVRDLAGGYRPVLDAILASAGQ